MLLLWYQSSSFLSRFIRFITRSPYSHVAIQVNSILYEALGRGITAHTSDQNYDGRMEDAVAYQLVNIEEKDRKEVVRFLTNQIGHRYSFSGFIFAGLASLTGYRLVVAVGGEYICSGLVATALLIAGEDIEEPRTETPASLAMRYKPITLVNATEVDPRTIQSAAQHRLTLIKD